MSMELRRHLIATAIAMNDSGLNQGTAGNVSARWQDGMLITPSGMGYTDLSPEDVVFVNGQGEPEGGRKPSSEWRFHLDIFRDREDAQAVVHAHPDYGTTLACLGRTIPAFHYMVAIAGGRNIRCAAYATPGTQALSDHVVAALRDRKACLMANHGMVCLDGSLERALALAVEVEQLARVYCHCLQLGEPELLGDDEMALMLDKFRGYGANAQNGG
jgi:L-fuculose-phosphate aldolase